MSDIAYVRVIVYGFSESVQTNLFGTPLLSVQTTLTPACIWDPAFNRDPASIRGFAVFRCQLFCNNYDIPE